MSIDLINITPNEIIELLKSEYYNQTGKTIQIGSDEFASTAVQAYVWPILFNIINNATKNRFLEYATGEYLDSIAATFGIEARPSGYRATATFQGIPVVSLPVTIPANEITVTDGNGNSFVNIYPITLIGGPATPYERFVLYSTEPGSAHNGVPRASINTILEGGEYLSDIVNTTQTAGGTDGFPYTPEGDEAYREYIKLKIQSFACAGTYKAYEARAKSADPRVLDAYVLRQDDAGYQKGKVKIFIQTDYNTDYSQVVREIVESYCRDDGFRPIGDFVEVSYAIRDSVTLNRVIQITYPKRFDYIATQRNLRILNDYKEILKKSINRPFVFEELCNLFTQKDSDGVYAVDAKPLMIPYDAYKAPIYPTPGGYIDPVGLQLQSMYDPRA